VTAAELDVLTLIKGTNRVLASGNGNVVPRDTGLDDVGNAARFAAQHGHALRYVVAWGCWLRYDGRKWAIDEVLEHFARAKETVRSLAQEAADEPDGDRRKKLLDHARRSASERSIRAMLNLAQELLVVTPADLDANPWLLNAQNGTVDLRTGQLRPHDAEDLLTMIAGADYDPEAKARKWDEHLRTCLVDEKVIAYLQRLAGVTAIGKVREHILLLLEGGGANGKTVTCNAIAGALGDYAHQSTVDLLMQTGRGPGQATPELADLRGRRLILVAETPEDGKLAAERVKAITGGDPITARRLYSNPFTFEPSHTIWVCTNYRPRVPDDSDGIWRRLTIIRFPVTIPEDRRDPEIGDKLVRERGGILAWIVRGLHAYLDPNTGGLNPPAAVARAAEAYRAGEDTFGAFLAERTIAEPDATAAGADLHRAYTAWAVTNGAPTLSSNALADRLQHRGIERKRTNRGTRYIGLRIGNGEGTLDRVATPATETTEKVAAWQLVAPPTETSLNVRAGRGESKKAATGCNLPPELKPDAAEIDPVEDGSCAREEDGTSSAVQDRLARARAELLAGRLPADPKERLAELDRRGLTAGQIIELERMAQEFDA
jgi:putative DNA primase/helicase